jgi:hypothetical protein
MTERKQGRGGGAAMKVLMPVVATLTSALASYLAKKGPQFLEQTVLPRLRETKPEVAGDDGDSGSGGDSGTSEPRPSDELEQRRRERAEHRAARRKAS